MLVSSCHLNVTYYTRQNSFENEPKTQQIQSASGLVIGMLLAMAPGTKYIHEQRAISANRTQFSMVLQHYNMDPATNLHVWSQNQCTEATSLLCWSIC